MEKKRDGQAFEQLCPSSGSLFLRALVCFIHFCQMINQISLVAQNRPKEGHMFQRV